ncbi:MAG: alginate lyase family protein [Proteobacteria bacterium]|nr:alginate lyase family protein [Pseudomonadota bacterium]
MRYHTRQKYKLGFALAVERLSYILLPVYIRKIIFLRTRINRHIIPKSHSLQTAIYQYSRAEKFHRINFWITSVDVSWFSKNCPNNIREHLLDSAKGICNHCINIHGAGKQSYGEKIEWSKDPITGKNFPASIFSSFPDADIDRRFLTELNLHRHFPILASAWLVTKDNQFADELMIQLLDWIRNNPPLKNAFISDGLEMSARVVCWTHCLILLQEYPISENDYIEILMLVDSYGALIENQYGAIGVKNNHQIAEAFGLFFIGVMYPELLNAKRWQEKGLEKILLNVKEQFHNDGVHAEQSISYHMFVLECCILTILLSKKNNISLSKEFYNIVGKALEFLSCLEKPNGKLPMLGDEAFRFFCPTGNPAYDHKSLITVGLNIIGYEKYLESINSNYEEVYWLLGHVEYRNSKAGKILPYNNSTKIFPDSGHVVVHSDGSHFSQYLHFKCGPQGLGLTAGHGHDDVLGVEYNVEGDDFLVDPGTYTYSKSNSLRRYFMGARAHNSVIVDGAGAAEPSDGAFGWNRTVNGDLVEVAASTDVVWIRGKHHGYKVDQNVLVVERAILLVRDCYLLLLDRVIGEGIHQIENLMHFHPDIELCFESDIVQAKGNKAKLLILSASSDSANMSLHQGEDNIQPSWYSSQYGELRSNTTLRTASNAELPFWRITALFPSRLNRSLTNMPQLRVNSKSEMKDSGNELLKFTLDMGAMTDNIIINWHQQKIGKKADNTVTMSLYRQSEKEIVLYTNREQGTSGTTSVNTPSQVNIIEQMYFNSEN